MSYIHELFIYSNLHILSCLIFSVVSNRWKHTPSVTAASPQATNVSMSVFGKSRRENRRTVIAHTHSILPLVALSIHTRPRGMCNIGRCVVGCDLDPKDNTETNWDETLPVMEATATCPSKPLHFYFYLFLFLLIFIFISSVNKCPGPKPLCLWWG